MTFPFSASSGDLNTDRRYEYAKDLIAEGDLDAAIDLLNQTAAHAPDWPVIPFTLGQLYRRQGQNDQAISCLEKCLSLDPDDHQGARLEMQLLGVRDSAEGMPGAFVAQLFDQYASRFDAHLMDTLKYNVPYLILKILKHYHTDFIPQRVLDLGCGTGLSAMPFANTASYIEGVDISAGMIGEARKKSIYHKLSCADLIAHLQQTDLKYDLIIAADVLTYFGDLSKIFETIRPHLDLNGKFIFSVQKLDAATKDFELSESHRYVHTSAYLERLIQGAGLVTSAQEEHVLRQDRGEDVWGYIYICEPVSR